MHTSWNTKIYSSSLNLHCKIDIFLNQGITAFHNSKKKTFSVIVHYKNLSNLSCRKDFLF